MHHTTKEFENLKKSKAVSEKTNQIHKGKLYAGYVSKRNEIEEKIAAMGQDELEKGSQVYSQIRGLSEGETFAANGMILHEVFFPLLGGDGKPEGTQVHEAIIGQYGSWQRFISELEAKSMSARGWAVLAYDNSDQRLHIYTADAQNQGGVWGSIPLMAIDVYEHAYMIDYGSDRKTYISELLKEINWQIVDQRFQKAASSSIA